MWPLTITLCSAYLCSSWFMGMISDLQWPPGSAPSHSAPPEWPPAVTAHSDRCGTRCWSGRKERRCPSPGCSYRIYGTSVLRWQAANKETKVSGEEWEAVRRDDHRKSLKENFKSYLQSAEQLAAMLYPGDVKQLIDGSVGELRAKLCVSLDSVQDLVFILWSSHLKKSRNTKI